MNARDCTCGTWDSVHEWHCGLPERDDDCTCRQSWIDADCTDHGHLILEAETVDERVAS